MEGNTWRLVTDMEQQVERAIRLTSMALRAMDGRVWTSVDVAREYAVSRRSAQRDLLALAKVISLEPIADPLGQRGPTQWRLAR